MAKDQASFTATSIEVVEAFLADAQATTVHNLTVGPSSTLMLEKSFD